MNLPGFGLMAFLRSLVTSLLAPILPQEDTVLPVDLAVIEIVGHVRHIGRVRRVGGLYEVHVEPEGTYRRDGHHTSDYVPRRLYGRSAIFQIRSLTPGEWRALEEARLLRERACRHCGDVECPKKGTTGEDVHIAGGDRIENTWCDHWVTWDTRHVAPEVARADRGQVTCVECLRVLDAPPVEAANDSVDEEPPASEEPRSPRPRKDLGDW